MLTFDQLFQAFPERARKRLSADDVVIALGKLNGEPNPPIRREFNPVGHPQLPDNPTLIEVARWLKDKALWQQLQIDGQEMNAREWASTCLTTAAEDIELAAKAP